MEIKEKNVTIKIISPAENGIFVAKSKNEDGVPSSALTEAYIASEEQFFQAYEEIAIEDLKRDYGYAKEGFELCLEEDIIHPSKEYSKEAQTLAYQVAEAIGDIKARQELAKEKIEYYEHLIDELK